MGRFLRAGRSFYTKRAPGMLISLYFTLPSARVGGILSPSLAKRSTLPKVRIKWNPFAFNNEKRRASAQNVVNHVSMNVCQAKVSTAISIR